MSGLILSETKLLHDQDAERGVPVPHDGPAARQMDIARDFARIHSVITFALEVSIERSELYAAGGYPDKATRRGFVSYVRCLSAILSAHHRTEDDLAFPYFWVKLPDLPVERLIAQHQQMDPLLDEIRTQLPKLVHSSQASQRMVKLHHALIEMRSLWQAHIEIEERHLSTERICAVIDQIEQARMHRVFMDYSRRLQRRTAPLSQLIPFVLYNLSREERPDLAPKMAGVVTHLLIPHVWRRKWQPMAPFLRDPPQI